MPMRIFHSRFGFPVNGTYVKYPNPKNKGKNLQYYKEPTLKQVWKTTNKFN
jgi:hypothetical protein